MSAGSASTQRRSSIIRLPDALQIAAALAAGCEAFLTNDEGLQRVNEISVLIVSDIEV